MEHIVGKGENIVNQHCLLFSHFLQKGIFHMIVKSRNRLVRGKRPLRYIAINFDVDENRTRTLRFYHFVISLQFIHCKSFQFWTSPHFPSWKRANFQCFNVYDIVNGKNLLTASILLFLYFYFSFPL